MEVILTHQKAFIREAIENGRLQHEEEAVREPFLCGKNARAQAGEIFG